MRTLSIFIFSSLLTTLASASASASASEYEQCLLEALSDASGKHTVADIQQQCASSKQSVTDNSQPVLEQRNNHIAAHDDNRFKITAYNRNYILPVTYRTNPDNVRSAELYDDADFDQVEVKFQLSIQAPVVENILNSNADVWVAYTQQSWWQLFNKDYSSPFRETNYEPEVFLRFNQARPFYGFINRTIALGYNHQSNGRSGELSRSWNRLFVSAAVDKSKLALSARVWWRIPEDRENDDNPDIEKYLGYGDLRAAYKWHQQLFSVTLRNNLRSDNKGALQLDWTFPLGSRFKAYFQYFNGYGESLIDYDQSVSRVGIGVLLTDWL